MANHSYRAQVGAVLEVLAEGLAPFVDRQMRGEYPDEDWIVTAATKLGKREPVLASPTDPQFQLEVMIRWWGPVFSPRLSKNTRDTIQQLRSARNDWAHIDDTHPIDLEYARQIHGLAEDLLGEIGSPMVDEAARRAEDLNRTAAGNLARERGVSESDALLLQLHHLQHERETLSRQLQEARETAQTAAGRQRAVARQLAELQAQYAAVSGLQERYRELQRRLDEVPRTDEPREAEDDVVAEEQLQEAETAVVQLQREQSRLHEELGQARELMKTLDPAETEIGRRWIMLVAALIMVLGIVIILAIAKGTTL